MKKYNTMILILVSLFLISCDKGLEPLDEAQTSNLNVRVSFVNEWPKKDSLHGLRVVAFKLPPSESLIDEVLNGEALFKDVVVDNSNESKDIQFVYKDLPIELKYIVVAWQYESGFTMQRIVGVYNISNKNEPGTVYLDFGETVNIDIEVDWNDFPPQPF